MTWQGLFISSKIIFFLIAFSLLGIVMMFGLFLFIIGIVAIVVLVAFNVYWLYMVYAGLSAILFMVYLAIDIQVCSRNMESSL